MSLIPFVGAVQKFNRDQQYQISRSLRFNSADSAHLSRSAYSVASAGTQWTLSMWVKRSGLSVQDDLFTFVATTGAAQQAGIRFQSDDTIRWWQYAPSTFQFQKVTTAVFRDVGAWYHLVFYYDTTLATAEDRLQIWVNGVRQTAFSTNTNPSQNLVTYYKTGQLYPYIGAENRNNSYLATTGLDGYLTEVNFIDGQALTPSSFGETNPATGVWQPKKYTGSYGSQGWYINFSDNSGTTSTTLGKDSSGNGNNWTPNNFSVTAGAGNDSLVDTPTPYGRDTGLGGEVRGNYATLNPLSTTVTLVDGNLNYSSSGTRFAAGTIFQTSGKFYAECVASGTFAAQGIAWGFSSGNANMPSTASPGISSINGTFYVYSGGGLLSTFNDTAFGSNFTNPFTVGQTWQYAVDVDTGRAWLGQNNTWYDSSFGTTGNPSTGSNPTFTILSPTTRNGISILCGINTAGGTFIFNFGQRPFAYTAPSGFKALCTQNLPTPTIGATSITQAGKYFNTVLYTGNGVQDRTISGVGFQPDFVWIKNRGATGAHVLYNAVTGGDKQLFSNLTNAEQTNNDITNGFASDGFIVGDNVTGTGNTNQNTNTYVAWNWKANGAGSSNTAGSITSNVSVNTTSGFSIVTYTGTGANTTVGHGLSVAPSMVIVKRRDSTGTWPVRHTSITAANTVSLNTTAASASATTVWNSTAPTSTVFSIGTSTDVNANTGTYVAYCFAPVAGYSAFGSYTGNGNADGPFIFTNHRPAFVLIKRTDSTTNWQLQDSARIGYNPDNYGLFPNLSNAEYTAVVDIAVDFLSNGFKVRTTDAGRNASGGTYIYMSLATNPFKFSLAR